MVFALVKNYWKTRVNKHNFFVGPEFVILKTYML